MKISIGIPTKSRYNSLSHTLLSIAMQDLKPFEVIVVDDSENPLDIRTDETYRYILNLFDHFGIKWKVLFGQKRGQHLSHQLVQDTAEGDLIFRVDDDCVLEPDCLRRLSIQFSNEKVGAVAPLVLMPNATFLPKELIANKIANIDQPNIQWFEWKGVNKDSDHLYSCFMYRKGIAKYDTALSQVAHREETIFSHEIHRAGYQLIITAAAKVWHFRQSTGGIRSTQDASLYQKDEQRFQQYLKAWGTNPSDSKLIYLNNGIGDHYAFKNILPLLREKYKNITLAVCFPEVFHDEEGLKLISIAEGELLLGPKTIDHDIYRKMDEWNWKESIVDAFKKLHL